MNTPKPQPIELEEGQQFIRETSLSSPLAADEQLGQLLESLIAQPPSVDTLFSLLEQLRAPFNHLLEKLAADYRNKLLPLSVDDQAFFLSVTRRWQQMATAYGIAADLCQPEATDLQVGKLRATLQQRALHYIGRELFEHYLARQEIPQGLWQKLHTCYAQAEERGLDHTPVDDANETTAHQTHCAATYIASLLIEMAGPYGHSLHNLRMIRDWAMNWSALVTLHPLDDDLEIPPYLVVLDQDKPLHLFDIHENPGPLARYLDSTRLGLQINHLLGQLQTRITPAQLGLGDDPAYLVRPLLVRLLRPWSQAAAPRKFRRFATKGSARATTGFAAMHFAVSGTHFMQPDPSIAYSRAATDAIQTFGQQVRPMPEASNYGQDTFTFDDWQVLNHSANGFRLARGAEGQRLGLGQAIAVCPHDGENFLLCRINWLMEEQAGGLVIGVSVLGGMPIAIGVRAAKTRERFNTAFRLPGSPITEEANSLLLPPGIYVPRAELELLQGSESSTVRMLHVIERGSDFDRVTYEAA